MKRKYFEFHAPIESNRKTMVYFQLFSILKNKFSPIQYQPLPFPKNNPGLKT